jgi:hypothetical protein
MLAFPHPRSLTMSDKQKQPVQKDAPKSQQGLGGQAKGNPGKGSEGVDGAELHRQSGHRVSDQGTHKRH